MLMLTKFCTDRMPIETGLLEGIYRPHRAQALSPSNRRRGHLEVYFTTDHFHLQDFMRLILLPIIGEGYRVVGIIDQLPPNA